MRLSPGWCSSESRRSWPPRKHFPGHGVGIAGLVEDLADAGIDDHLGADAAGQIGAEEGGPPDGDPVVGRLDDGVLLGVDAPAQFVPLAGGDVQLFPQAADLQAVGDARKAPRCIRWTGSVCP